MHSIAPYRSSPASRPALLCSNDLLAIPTPALSTITQPDRDIGQRSVELLIEALAADRPLHPRSSVLLAHGFRTGESCAAAPDR